MLAYLAAAHAITKQIPRLIDCVLLHEKVNEPWHVSYWLSSYQELVNDQLELDHCSLPRQHPYRKTVFGGQVVELSQLVHGICFFNKWQSAKAAEADIDMLLSAIVPARERNLDMTLEYEKKKAMATAEKMMLSAADPTTLYSELLARIDVLVGEARDKKTQRAQECTMSDEVFKALGFIGKNAPKSAPQTVAGGDGAGDVAYAGAGVLGGAGGSAGGDGACAAAGDVAPSAETNVLMDSLLSGAVRVAKCVSDVLARTARMRASLVRLRSLKAVLMKDGRWKALVEGEHNAGFCLEQSTLLPQLLKGELAYSSLEYSSLECRRASPALCSPDEQVVNELVDLATKSKGMSESNRMCLNNDTVYRDSERHEYDYDY
jgi:hypothetical protein